MFSRITCRTYRQFVSTYAKNYNWGTPKMNRVQKKKWNETTKIHKNNSNLEEKKNTTKSIKNCYSNFPVDLNNTNNWKLETNRDIFLL